MLPHERVHTGSKSESVAEIKRLGSLVDCCVFQSYNGVRSWSRKENEFNQMIQGNLEIVIYGC